MSRYRHYRNSAELGVPFFVTTTALDFVHAFHSRNARDAMAFHLVRESMLGGQPSAGL